MRRLALLAVLLAGCRDKPSPAAAATAEPEPHGWRLAGKALAPAAVLATGTAGETSLRVTVATAPLDCAALRAAYPDHAAAGTVVDLWLAQPVDARGRTEGWSFRSASVAAPGREAQGLVARGAMLEDVAVAADAVVVKGLELALQDRKTQELYQYEGDLRAQLCGRAPRKEPDRPQKLKLAVAGQPIEVHGASLHGDGNKTYLRLTHAPHRCDSAFSEGYDFDLDLAREGDPPKLALAALLGDVYPETAAGSKGKESFVVKPAGPLDGAGAIAIALAGKLDLGGYAVELDGEVDALRCKSRVKSP